MLDDSLMSFDRYLLTARGAEELQDGLETIAAAKADAETKLPGAGL